MSSLFTMIREFARRYTLACFVIALVATGTSPLWTHDVAYSQSDLTHMELGFPVPFLTQNLDSLTPPDEYFPHAFSFDSPWEYPYSSVPVLFAADVMIDTVILWILLFGIYASIPALRPLFRILSARYVAAAVGIGILGICLLIAVFITIVTSQSNRIQIHLAAPTGAPILPPVPPLPAPQSEPAILHAHR